MLFHAERKTPCLVLIVLFIGSLLGACTESRATNGPHYSRDTGADATTDAGAGADATTDTGADVSPDTTPAPTCDDGVKNGDETDVDCGGGDCAACAPGSGCAQASDCTEGVCSGGICAAAACGDGAVNGTEQCDDGTANADDVPDACRTSCVPASCGDGVRDTGEACDDGNNTDGDGCAADCSAVEHGYTCTEDIPNACATTCGDTLIAGAEQCDDGNTDPGDGCDGNCHTETGWNCTTDEPSQCTPGCGDGLVVGSEECDDGGESATCDADCTFVVCGDGTTNTTAGEECDGGGESATCDADCTQVVCGDGVKNATAGEECDDGNTVDGDGCDATCHNEVCGDGIVNNAGAEQCDDGNTVDGDGCDAHCMVECPGTKTYCVGVAQCVDTSSDNANCGTCANACSSSQMCVSGACISRCTGVDCSAENGPCANGVCVVQNGVPTCQAQPIADGDACNAASVTCETSTSICHSGSCIGVSLSGDAATCPLQMPTTFLNAHWNAWHGSHESRWVQGTAACQGGEVLTGLKVRHNGRYMPWIGWVQGICSTVSVSGDSYTLSERGNTTALGYGASINSTTDTLRCPAGEMLIGITGRAGTSIDAVGLRCAPYSLSAYNGTRAIVRGNISMTPIKGNSGGSNFTDDCPNVDVARRLQFLETPGTIGSTGLRIGCNEMFLPVP